MGTWFSSKWTSRGAWLANNINPGDEQMVGSTSYSKWIEKNLRFGAGRPRALQALSGQSAVLKMWNLTWTHLILIQWFFNSSSRNSLARCLPSPRTFPKIERSEFPVLRRTSFLHASEFCWRTSRSIMLPQIDEKSRISCLQEAHTCERWRAVVSGLGRVSNSSLISGGSRIVLIAKIC